jgi:hypothetical protein
MLTLIRVSLCIAALAAPCLGQEPAFTEIAPDIAVASKDFTAKNRHHLWADADGAWAPTPEQALAAFSLLRSERGKRAVMENTQWSRMEDSLRRLDKSRYQIFGLTLRGRRHLLVDATPLDSDAPELWLTDCISCSVFDGGAAYWWVLVRVEPLAVIRSGRRP